MSLTLAQEMLNMKLNCDGFMTDSESEEEGVSKLSKKSGALIDVKSIILSPSSLLLRGFQTVNLIEELDLRQKKSAFSPWAGRRSGPARMRTWSIGAPHCPHEIPRRPG